MSEFHATQLGAVVRNQAGEPNQATKYDSSKPRYDLLPPEALEEIVKVLGFGASKYEPRGWEKGLPYSRYFGAVMRHLWAWWRGEDLDPESGLSHLAHAGACVLFLLAYVKWGHQTTDDRPRKG